jgi:hypothetical protein
VGGTIPSSNRPQARGRVPLWLKLVYTAFVAVLVPVYWHGYGPTNFLYYCDVALLLTVPAVWLESPLLASMGSVGITIPQLLWQIDFLSGAHVVGLTAYMFKPPFYLRALSFFHFWLPILLIWMVFRLGYDRRAFVAWTLLAWALLLVCYFLMPPPLDVPEPAGGAAGAGTQRAFAAVTPPDADRPVNINYAYGFDDKKAQTAMAPGVWVAAMAAALPLLIFLPVHLLLKRFAPPAEAAA